MAVVTFNGPGLSIGEGVGGAGVAVAWNEVSGLELGTIAVGAGTQAITNAMAATNGSRRKTRG